MAAGATSGSQHTGSGSPGGTSRSALGAIKAIGGVDEFEQPAIRNAAMHNRVFDPVTINHLFLDYFDSADLRFLLLFFCKLQITSGQLALKRSAIGGVRP